MGLFRDLGKSMTDAMFGPAEHEPVDTAAPRAASPTTTYETMTVVLDMGAGLFGKYAGRDARKLEKLLADGWQIESQVSRQFGTQRTTYTLRRARQ